MTSVSNAAVGAFLAGNAAAKARHGMNEAIARLSTCLLYTSPSPRDTG